MRTRSWLVALGLAAPSLAAAQAPPAPATVVIPPPPPPALCAPGDSVDECVEKVLADRAVQDALGANPQLAALAHAELVRSVAEQVAMGELVLADPKIDAAKLAADVAAALAAPTKTKKKQSEPMSLPYGCGAVSKHHKSIYADQFTVCVDATDGLRVVGFPTGNGFEHPLPQQRVRVLVRQGPDDRVSIGWDGTPGATAAGLDGGTAPSHGVMQLKGANAGSPITRWVPYVLPTFVPGDVVLHLAVTPGELEDLKSAATALEARCEAAKGTGATPADQTALDQALLTLRKSATDLREKVWALKSADGGWAGRATTELTHVAGRLDALSLAGVDATKGDAIPALNQLAKAIDAVAAQVAEADPVQVDVPLTVDSTYAGALRAGVALQLLGAADADYAPVDVDGQKVIDAAGVSDLDLELVLGYSHYIHRVPSTSHTVRYGPTVAVGIADLTQSEITVLQSAFAGFELGWSGLSFAVGGSVRQVDRLKDVYTVGGAVPADLTATDLVSQRWGFGPSIVVYAPQLLKVRNGGSGS